MKKVLRNVQMVTLCFLLACTVLWATATFTPYEQSYYGKISPVKKYVATITPTVAADVNSSDRMDDDIYGTLRRISFRTVGTDTAFGVLLRDENGIVIFSKADCNTVQMPLTYSLYTEDVDGYPQEDVLVAGRLYFDVNNVDYTSEKQIIQITSDANDPCGGTFELAYNDVNTAPIAYDVNAAEVEAALEAISTIDDVTVDGNNLPGDANVMTVTFLGTQYGSDVNLMTIDVNNLTVDTPGTIITGTITESVKGDYGLDVIYIDLYYTDPKY